MKALVKILSIFTFLLTIVILPIKAYAVEEPTKVINVVYDDSGSMIFDFDDTQQKVDTWCQAKYSMEVFAAMLGEKDTMNVYVMSDYYKKIAQSPRLTLYGVDGANVNVEKVHGLLTDASETPFDSVKKAYEDLNDVESDVKWLVVLTDGAFGDMSNEGVDAFFAAKNPDINIMFLGMGASAASITEKTSQNIFFEKAESSNQILNRITEICNRIFNSDKLPEITDNQISFDIPMQELTIFAQGDSVCINSLTDQNGKIVTCENPVDVRYSEIATSKKSDKYNNPKIDSKLMGSIATFRGDFDPGSYSLDITGAETLEVYYKPNVEVGVYLVDSEGNEISSDKNVKEGDYCLSLGFVKSGTTDKVANSTLLGEVTHEVTIINNGQYLDGDYHDGDVVHLEEGDVSVHVTASYLKYNIVSTTKDYSIIKDKEIVFEEINNPVFTVGSDGIMNSEDRIEVKATIDGREFTEEEWRQVDVPSISIVKKIRSFAMDDPEIEKMDSPGMFKIKPYLVGKKPSSGVYGDVEYNIDFNQTIDDSVWLGKYAGIIQYMDERSWIEQHYGLFLRLVILAATLAILAGYLPLFKHYLPKGLKAKPRVECRPEMPGEKKKERFGSVKKNWISTLIPYMPQRGTIRFLPKGVGFAPPMKVVAVGRNRMKITNTKSYIGKDVSFDREIVKKDTKPLIRGAGDQIMAKSSGWKYICYPNQKAER